MIRVRRLGFGALLLALSLNTESWAQCGPGWLADTPSQAMSLGPAALVRHPDGTVYAGGQFTIAGGVSVSCVARWDGSVWARVGPNFTTGNVTPRVHALTVMPNGDLVAAGHFGGVGGVPTNHIARWNGVAWSPLGDGLAGASSGNSTQVFALMALPNGDLIVGGEFTHAGGVPALRIARWDGTNWSAFGPGFGSTSSFEPVYALATLHTGEIVAGGQFTFSGPTSVARIARWTGAAWAPFGSGLLPQTQTSAAIARALVIEANGSLVVGGRFVGTSGVSSRSIMRWSNGAWSAVGGGIGSEVQHEVYALTIDEAGRITAGGSFQTAGGLPANAIARWDGTAWSTFSGGVSTGSTTAPSVRSLCVVPDDELLVGGTFTFAGGSPATRFARWSDTQIPVVMALHETPALSCGDTATFAISLAAGYPSSQTRWQIDQGQGSWADLTDGPVVVHGVTIAQALGTESTTLSLTPLESFDSLPLRCAVSNICGTTFSEPGEARSSCGTPCDPDFNQDGNVDQDDIACLAQVVAGDPFCSLSDPDFNGDGNVDQDDIDTLAQVVGGAACP